MEQSTLREFDALTKLLQHIPKRVMRAFRAHAIDWTSIDAAENFLAVGCNAGAVFLYDRATQEMQRLESEVSISM